MGLKAAPAPLPASTARGAAAAAETAAVDELPELRMANCSTTLPVIRGRLAAVEAFIVLMRGTPLMAARNGSALALPDDAYCRRVANALLRVWEPSEWGPVPDEPAAFVRKWMKQMKRDGSVLDKVPAKRTMRKAASAIVASAKAASHKAASAKARSAGAAKKQGAAARRGVKLPTKRGVVIKRAAQAKTSPNGKGSWPAAAKKRATTAARK